MGFDFFEKSGGNVLPYSKNNIKLICQFRKINEYEEKLKFWELYQLSSGNNCIAVVDWFYQIYYDCKTINGRFLNVYTKGVDFAKVGIYFEFKTIHCRVLDIYPKTVDFAKVDTARDKKKDDSYQLYIYRLNELANRLIGKFQSMYELKATVSQRSDLIDFELNKIEDMLNPETLRNSKSEMFKLEYKNFMLGYNAERQSSFIRYDIFSMHSDKIVEGGAYYKYKFYLKDINYYKNINLAPDKKKLTQEQVALIHVYNGLPITSENADEIAASYGWDKVKSGHSLKQDYTKYCDKTNRSNVNETEGKRSINKRITRIEEILDQLNPDGYIRANKDIEQLTTAANNLI